MAKGNQVNMDELPALLQALGLLGTQYPDEIPAELFAELRALEPYVKKSKKTLAALLKDAQIQIPPAWRQVAAFDDLSDVAPTPGAPAAAAASDEEIINKLLATSGHEPGTAGYDELKAFYSKMKPEQLRELANTPVDDPVKAAGDVVKQRTDPEASRPVEPTVTYDEAGNVVRKQTPGNMPPPVPQPPQPPRRNKVSTTSQASLLDDLDKFLTKHPDPDAEDAIAWLKKNKLINSSTAELSDPDVYAKARNQISTEIKRAKTAAKDLVGPKLGTDLNKIELPLDVQQQLEKYGIRTAADYGRKVPVSVQNPHVRRALREFQGGNDKMLKAIIQGGQDYEDVFDLTPEMKVALQKAKTGPEAVAKLQAIRDRLAEATKVTSGDDVGMSFLSFGKSRSEVRKLTQTIDKLLAEEDVDKINTFLQRYENNFFGVKGVVDRAPSTAAQADRLAEIKAKLADEAKLGLGTETATVEQLGARIPGAIQDAKAAGHSTGLRGFMQNPVAQALEAKAATGDAAAKKALLELRKTAAKEFGAGAEAGLLAKGESFVAKVGGKAKAGLGLGLVALPLIMELFGHLKEETENRRQTELMRMEQSAAPTVEQLLQRYRQQQFLERGVNNAAPNPKILEALQRMGPQLTPSEVYIGPDETVPNAQALMAHLGD